METSVIVAICAFLVSAVGLLLNTRKDTRNSAAETATIEAKLDSIGRGVDDIRVEFRTMRDKVDGQAQRLTAIETRVSAIEHRLDKE
jgi:predicted  nucleic acid-binding Zn-ribbon protein